MGDVAPRHDGRTRRALLRPAGSAWAQLAAHPYARLLLLLLAGLAYVAAYPLLYASAGYSAGVLAVPAVLLVVWYRGLRPGLVAAGLAGLIVNPLLASWSGSSAPWLDAFVSGMPGFAAMLIATVALGRLRDMSVRLRAELAERARAEAALREHKEQYQQLVELAEDIMYRADADGLFTYVSPVVERVLGYRPDELLGRHFLYIVAPEAHRAARLFYYRHVARQLPGTYNEVPVLTRDGQRRWLAQHVRAVMHDGVLTGFQAVARDVTDRVEAGAALRLSEHRYRSVVENVKDVVFQADTDGRWTLLNPAWEEITGFTVEASLHRPAIAFLHPDDRAACRARFAALLEGRTDTIRSEVRLCTAADETRWVEVHARALHDADGTLAGIAGTISDFTDSRRVAAEREARQKAEELLRLKTAFLNNMSHEIRTPLTGILGFAEILAEEIDEPYRAFARRIEKSGARLLATLNSVLDLAQLEANSVSLHPEPVDVTDEIREVLLSLTPLAEEKGLALTLLPAPEADTTARLDRACLSRIATNLVGNAIKFTRSGGVTVETRATEDEVAFAVRDTGIGIAEDALPHLFSEFWQESAGQGRSHEGSGLGLSITKRLVELMHGHICVESRQGEGSTFTVTFPRPPEADQPNGA